MPNVIALRKTYSTLLDEAYKLASLTAVLDGPNDLAQEGANANEILIPKMSMSGLADYDKQTGYALGDVTLDYETKKCDYDRGRMFTVDAMDNIESAGIAFGRLSGEFLRTQVVPELDTWRLAKYAGYASGNNVVTGAIADGKAGIAAIRAGKTAIKNAEAKTETCLNRAVGEPLLQGQDRSAASCSYQIDFSGELYPYYHDSGSWLPSLPRQNLQTHGRCPLPISRILLYRHTILHSRPAFFSIH